MLKHLFICFFFLVGDGVGLQSEPQAGIVGVGTIPPRCESQAGVVGVRVSEVSPQPWDSPPPSDHNPPPYDYSTNITIVLTQAQRHEPEPDHESHDCASTCEDKYLPKYIVTRVLIIWGLSTACAVLYFAIYHILLLYGYGK